MRSPVRRERETLGVTLPSYNNLRGGEGGEGGGRNIQTKGGGGRIFHYVAKGQAYDQKS